MKSMLFKPEMAQSVFTDLKTQTRREITQLSGIGQALSFQPSNDRAYDWMCCDKAGAWHWLTHDLLLHRCPHPKGSFFYVREPWGFLFDEPLAEARAGQPRFYLGEVLAWHHAARVAEEPLQRAPAKWRSPLHCGEQDSRSLCRITDVRIERLQRITNIDARAEGAVQVSKYAWSLAPHAHEVTALHGTTPHAAFERYWYFIHKMEVTAWLSNPLVWVYTFERLGVPRYITVAEQSN